MNLRREQGTRDHWKILKPKGSNTSIDSLNMPTAIQCDPGSFDESMLTIKKPACEQQKDFELHFHQNNQEK